MTTLLDAPVLSAQSAGQHETFISALQACTEHALGEYLHGTATVPELPAGEDVLPVVRAPRRRLEVAATAVETVGVPRRHQAARQLVTGFLGVYDAYFGLADGWRPEFSWLTDDVRVGWTHEDGARLVDIVRADAPSHPVWDSCTAMRCRTLVAAHTAVPGFAGVRVLAVTAPDRSLFADAHGQLHRLADTRFAGPVAGWVTR